MIAIRSRECTRMHANRKHFRTCVYFRPFGAKSEANRG
jgi:hypothetical protein